MLITSPITKDEINLPSPEMLKGKILLKCKKLPKHEKELLDETFEENADKGLDLCDTVKNGKMYIQTKQSSWEPYFFALTDGKLIYTEIDEEKDGDQECDKRKSVNVRQY